jgi:hypothetical protein
MCVVGCVESLKSKNGSRVGFIHRSGVKRHSRTKVQNPTEPKDVHEWVVSDLRNTSWCAARLCKTIQNLTPEGPEAFHLVEHVLSCFSVRTGARNTIVHQPHSLPIHVFFPRGVFVSLDLRYRACGWHTVPK